MPTMRWRAPMTWDHSYPMASLHSVTFGPGDEGTITYSVDADGDYPGSYKVIVQRVVYQDVVHSFSWTVVSGGISRRELTCGESALVDDAPIVSDRLTCLLCVKEDE